MNINLYREFGGNRYVKNLRKAAFKEKMDKKEHLDYFKKLLDEHRKVGTLKEEIFIKDSKGHYFVNDVINYLDNDYIDALVDVAEKEGFFE